MLSYKSESIKISCHDLCLALQWCFGNQKTDTDNLKTGGVRNVNRTGLDTS